MSTGKRYREFHKVYNKEKDRLEKKYGTFSPEQHDYTGEGKGPRSIDSGKQSAIKDYRATRAAAHEIKQEQKHSRAEVMRDARAKSGKAPINELKTQKHYDHEDNQEMMDHNKLSK